MNDQITPLLVSTNGFPSWMGDFSITEGLIAALKEENPIEKIFQQNMASLRTLNEEMMQLVISRRSSSYFPQFYSTEPPLLGFTDRHEGVVTPLKNRCKDIQLLAVKIVLYHSCSSKEKELMSSLQRTSTLVEQYLRECFLPPPSQFNQLREKRIIIILAGSLFLVGGITLTLLVRKDKTMAAITGLIYGSAALLFFTLFFLYSSDKSLQSYSAKRIDLASTRYLELKRALELPV